MQEIPSAHCLLLSISLILSRPLNEQGRKIIEGICVCSCRGRRDGFSYLLLFSVNDTFRRIRPVLYFEVPAVVCCCVLLRGAVDSSVFWGFFFLTCHTFQEQLEKGK